MVDAGILYTPPLDGTLLNGITRDSVLKLAADLGIPTREQAIPREMLYIADELFFTGTASEITPVRSVDRIEVGGGGMGPITETLQKEYLGIATGERPDPYGWLEPIHDTVNKGFDLICYSGGKGLRGPYSAGLLLGRKDLVRYARQNSAPNDVSIGRGMKVSAEEYLGMLVALETGLNITEKDDFAYKRKRFGNIITQLADVSGITTRVFVSAGETNELYLDIDWDTDLVRISREEFIEALRAHTPAVEVRMMLFSGGRIHLSATVMDEGQDVIVGQIIKKVLIAHSPA